MRDEHDISTDPVEDLFRKGHRVPSLDAVAQISLSDILRLLTSGEAMPPPWAEQALAASTRSSHRRILKWIEKSPQNLRQLPLTRALGQYFTMLREQRRWTWATMLKNIVTLQGALALLPMYRQVKHGISLKMCSSNSSSTQTLHSRSPSEEERA